MRVWVVRDYQDVSVWAYDDKPKIYWINDRKGKSFILRGDYECLAENYGQDTEIEKKIGKKLRHKEIVETDW